MRRPTTPGCLKPTRTALLWTRHTTRTSPCFSSSFAPRTLALKVYTAANQFWPTRKVTSWNLKAFKHYYIPVPPNGIAGIVVEPTENLLRLQQALLDAVAPFTERTGTAAAFVSDDGGRDIQQGLIDYVTNFTTVASGKKFNPHVTIGVAPEAYLNEMLAEPFQTFTFSPVGASVYQLGSFGAARKELQALSLTP